MLVKGSTVKVKPPLSGVGCRSELLGAHSAQEKIADLALQQLDCVAVRCLAERQNLHPRRFNSS